MRKQLLLTAALLPLLSGAQWTLIPSGVGTSFESIDFVGNVGVMSGLGVLMRTTDQGNSWTQVLTGGGYRDVDFADATTVYCAGTAAYAMYKSTNGGQTWTQLTPPTSNSLWGVSAPSTGSVYFCGTGGVVWETNTGGSPFVIDNNSLDTGTNSDVHFVDDQTGFLATQPRKVYRTVDGGDNWAEVYYHPTATILYSIYFPDALHGCVVGASGAVATTVDGGANWTTQNSGTTSYLRSVHFHDANNGIAVGFGGTVIRTTNGGISWFLEPSFTTEDLEVAYLFSPTSAIVGGGNGVIYKNTNLTTGIDGIEQEVLSPAYPNPTTGEVIIPMPSVAVPGIMRALVMDQAGRCVLDRPVVAGATLRMDLAHLVPGEYVIVLKGQGAVERRVRVARM